MRHGAVKMQAVAGGQNGGFIAFGMKDQLTRQDVKHVFGFMAVYFCFPAFSFWISFVLFVVLSVSIDRVGSFPSV